MQLAVLTLNQTQHNVVTTSTRHLQRLLQVSCWIWGREVARISAF